MAQQTAISGTVISQIDRQIDAIRKEIIRRVGVRPLNASDWQAAWDRNPQLRKQETELFRARGVAQKERDAKAQKDWLRSKPRNSATKKCPTCGARTRQAA